MSVIEKLASSLNRRDEKPNQELAKIIAECNDKPAVTELINLLQHKSKAIQSDSIKVLYEIGAIKPALLTAYIKNFIGLLDDKNNRNIWGAMSALDSVTLEDPKQIYNNLPKIMSTAEKGSVITKDHAVKILIKLGTVKQFAKQAFTLLIEILTVCPTNQLPMYAENAIPVIDEHNKVIFINTLKLRLSEIEKETKRNRVEKVIKKIS